MKAHTTICALLLLLLSGCSGCPQHSNNRSDAAPAHLTESNAMTTTAAPNVTIIGPDLLPGTRISQQFDMKTTTTERRLVGEQLHEATATVEMHFDRRTVILDAAAGHVHRAKIFYESFHEGRSADYIVDGAKRPVALPEEIPGAKPSPGQEYVVEARGPRNVVVEFDGRNPTPEEQDVPERNTVVALSLILSHGDATVRPGQLPDAALTQRLRKILAVEARVFTVEKELQVNIQAAVVDTTKREGTVAFPFTIEGEYRRVAGLIEDGVASPARLIGSGEVVFGQHGLPLLLDAKAKLVANDHADAGRLPLAHLTIRSTWSYEPPPGRSWRFESVEDDHEGTTVEGDQTP